MLAVLLVAESVSTLLLSTSPTVSAMFIAVMKSLGADIVTSPVDDDSLIRVQLLADTVTSSDDDDLIQSMSTADEATV